MLELEATTEVLEAWGEDIVKFARINIGDTSRKRKSKITGKLRKGKIDSSGKLRNSLGTAIVVNKNSFGFKITGEDYAEDVDSGAPRKANINRITNWIKKKPVRFRGKDGKIIKKTPARIASFANFVAWKVEHIGSDQTNYLRDAIEDASKKHEQDLAPALFRDVEASVTFAFNSIQKKI